MQCNATVSPLVDDPCKDVMRRFLRRMRLCRETVVQSNRGVNFGWSWMSSLVWYVGGVACFATVCGEEAILV